MKKDNGFYVDKNAVRVNGVDLITFAKEKNYISMIALVLSVINFITLLVLIIK